jgi:hypothetical protein
VLGKIDAYTENHGLSRLSFLNADFAGGPRAACAAGRDADARGQLARVKTSHGYR